jgi:hypothetical protein
MGPLSRGAATLEKTFLEVLINIFSGGTAYAMQHDAVRCRFVQGGQYVGSPKPHTVRTGTGDWQPVRPDWPGLGLQSRLAGWDWLGLRTAVMAGSVGGTGTAVPSES